MIGLFEPVGSYVMVEPFEHVESFDKVGPFELVVSQPSHVKRNFPQRFSMLPMLTEYL